MTDPVLAAWRTNNRVMIELVARLPKTVWVAEVPGIPRKSIRGIAAHVHNCRCSWVKTLGREHGVPTPERVDAYRATQRQVAAALKRSGAGIEALLVLGIENGGTLPPSKGYVWRNLSLEVPHVLTYFVAHEGHHRGQIVMAARQAGHRLPVSVTGGLWQWKA